MTLISLFLFLNIFVDRTTTAQLLRDRRPTVQLPQGFVTGTKVYGDEGKIADAYLGIPYATPPTGNLRFAPPIRHPGWNGTFQALEYAPRCPQLPFVSSTGTPQSEDCLYLNIWAPENALRYGPLPVLVYLEGNEFQRANFVPTSGLELAIEGALVVTVTYRLNVFGFLCLGTQDVRGNLGLIDQYFAMVWVKENARYFGGDPDKITLFGNAAGAASVSLHMISPRTNGLFQRVIISSGSATSPWHVATKLEIASQKFVHILGCNTNYYAAMLQCLRSKSTGDILRAYEEHIESGFYADTFLPVVDDFLPENDRYLPLEPSVALKDGTYIQVPILTGISRPILDPQYRQWLELAGQGYLQLQQYFEQSKIPEVMRRYHFNTGNKDEISELLKWRYLSASQGDVRRLLEQMKQFQYETKIEIPHFLQLNYLAATFVQPIYVYFIDDIAFTLNNTDTIVTSDILLLFGPVLLNQINRRRFNTNELRLSRRLKRLWINFIIFGNPTPNNNIKTWNRYLGNEYYIENFETVTQTNEVEKFRTISFWTNLLPKLNNTNLPTINDPRELQYGLDGSSGFRHAMYTLVGLVIALLGLLVICIVLLKQRNKETERHLNFTY